MAENIKPVEFAKDTFRRLWNVQVVDYEVDTVPVDFETLIVRFATGRASTIENEVSPLAKRIQDRNARLETLGEALSDLSGAQQQMSKDGEDSVQETGISADTAKLLLELDPTITNGSTTITKAACEKAIQLIKTKMDRLNNDSSSDMTSLQSLVDKRDESFSTASSLMQAISDTRSGAIQGLAVN